MSDSILCINNFLKKQKVCFQGLYSLVRFEIQFVWKCYGRVPKEHSKEVPNCAWDGLGRFFG